MRCFDPADATYRAYHDDEWGRPTTDERGLYEKICLEGFQAGISWLIVLRKRPALRAAFAGFDPEAVAAFGEDEIERLAADPALIRNAAKLRAAVTNAQATIALRDTDLPLPDLVWSHRPAPRPAPQSRDDLPTSTPESAELARRLKAAGFRFVGPTTMYALMQAEGLVNDHLADCDWRAAVEADQAAAAATLGLAPA